MLLVWLRSSIVLPLETSKPATSLFVVQPGLNSESSKCLRAPAKCFFQVGSEPEGCELALANVVEPNGTSAPDLLV